MQIRNALPDLPFLPLAACATNAPVEKADRNTFIVRTHIVGSLSGGDDARSANAKRATEFCAGRGTTMTILDDQAIGGFLPQDTLKFRCGAADQRTPRTAQTPKGA